MTNLADIGVIGLAVMGQNLILNMNDQGHTVVAYNRTVQKTRDFLAGAAAGTKIQGAESLEQLVDALQPPRRIMLMVKAGDAVDAVIEQLCPLMTTGDIIIDGGNSNFVDTQRRADELAERGLRFVGTGVSGGEEGARHGPSLMPGGHAEAWPEIRDLFQSIAAKTDAGQPCCDWVGDGGAGHFVKMVHNGIEYGDMQLICEAYHFMSDILGFDNSQLHQTFSQWNTGKLDSYLIEITANIIAHQENGEYVVDQILDRAGQKGTGKWTATYALDLGVPLTLINEAVTSRYLSALKTERVHAATLLDGPDQQKVGEHHTWVDDLQDALFAAKIVSYAQGYMLMHSAADRYGWDLQYGAIAQMWRGGCIIRAAFLDDIKTAYDEQPALANLLLDDHFRDAVHQAQSAWRRIVARAAMDGVPMPAMSSALAFFDGYRSERLPANLLQAQRDYFGAHTYHRVDGGEETFHTDWIGSGGHAVSTSYNA